MKLTVRRAAQAFLYEIIALAFVGPVVGWLFDRSTATGLQLALLMSAIALAWNYVFNTLFERWEARQAVGGRSLGRRLAHGVGVEGGLTVFLVPVIAAVLDVPLAEAFVANLGILAFFFVYAIVFTWGFDRVFGLPASAAAR